MRADRTVIVIGAFLFMIGLAVAWNGYGYIELERGWSMVIAGTFGFCTGLVLVALGLVLRELEAISSSADRATLLLAKAKTNGQPETYVAPPPTPLEPEPAFEPPAVEETPQERIDAEPLLAGTEVLPATAFEQSTEEKQPAPLAWMIRTNRSETSKALKMPQAAKSDDWLYETPEAPAAAPHEEPAPVEAEAEMELEPKTKTKPEPKPEREHETTLEPGPEAEPTPEAAPEPAMDEPEPAMEVEEPTKSVETPPQPALETESEPKSAAESEIIGHYDAHGAHYTMYADGSIDAETPHGVYRFASMEELKRFIEGQ